MTDPFNLHEVADRLTERFAVDDIVLPTSDCIFILESPHTQELKFGAPVSGTSGQTMTRHLFGEEYAKFPLGHLVKKHAEGAESHPRLRRVGLLNVSNIPLQAAAYPDDVRRQYAEWLSCFEQVRTANHKLEFTDPCLNAVQADLVTRLRAKLTALVDRSCVLIPCGRFAQKFVRLANVHSPMWQRIDDVPHPSYNSWDRMQYAPVIAAVQRAFNAPLAKNL